MDCVVCQQKLFMILTSMLFHHKVCNNWRPNVAKDMTQELKSVWVFCSIVCPNEMMEAVILLEQLDPQEHAVNVTSESNGFQVHVHKNGLKIGNQIGSRSQDLIDVSTLVLGHTVYDYSDLCSCRILSNDRVMTPVQAPMLWQCPIAFWNLLHTPIFQPLLKDYCIVPQHP